ncbi:hypothetical protein SEVIR_7G286283v4 [Setaria viridis]
MLRESDQLVMSRFQFIICAHLILERLVWNTTSRQFCRTKSTILSLVFASHIQFSFVLKLVLIPKLLFASSGVNTHLYCFSVEHGNDNLKSFVCSEQCGPSLLDTILLSQWDNFAWKGHLDYDVTACQLKVIQIKAMVFLILISYWFFFYHANIDKP